jgi:hypothetical protein
MAPAVRPSAAPAPTHDQAPPPADLFRQERVQAVPGPKEDLFKQTPVKGEGK